MTKQLPALGILLGEAAGIGPELVAKMVQHDFFRGRCRAVIIGDARVYDRASAILNAAGRPRPDVFTDARNAAAAVNDTAPVLLDLQHLDPATVPLGEVRAHSGRACLEQMDRAVALCRDGVLDGFCYAPFNKASLIAGGSDLPSELEYLARAFGCTDVYGEMNVVDNVWTTRVTSHIPLSEVSSALTADRVLASIRLADDTIRRTGSAPRIGVAALNPHAGENGLCGREEIDVIGPAVLRAQEAGINARGPWSADTIFVRAFAGDLDAVVTMYHDQGQIALKVRGFDHGVTVNAGLPFPVTTCTHGTAFDIVGKGKAWTTALETAVRILAQLTS